MAIEVGSKVQGKVTGITNFGAFVEMPGGTTGLVHISEVADSYVKDVNDHLTKGDQVEVKIISEKEGKIALSIKKAIDKPPEAKRQERQGRDNRNSKDNRSRNNFKKESFEDKMANFLKTSEENLSTLKRSTETKRGGRGGRRG
ncbi:S1 RNA binding domain protein [Virgibacillus natechei]|uniref:S1 RNA binding domain protein n=1 Tax=Virgibacillus natechei TaxID=1216297 RepID=A0ABS4IDW4_9BACI|nr:S1 domain-containing RNA-binding protein [Virgibacillus natechei]MBP1969118.1 S1 RNA binding domain protein [Virgibacillus natechei]UZD14384.1 S1 domain-containing RNA-binding protein [Virgibacillus natechei]